MKLGPGDIWRVVWFHTANLHIVLASSFGTLWLSIFGSAQARLKLYCHWSGLLRFASQTAVLRPNGISATWCCFLDALCLELHRGLR
jgi:hypothetical protein